MNTARSNFENKVAYHEGRRAYFQGIPREKNNYETLNDEDQAEAWWRGWDQAQEEDLGLSDNSSQQNDPEPRE